MLQFWFLWQMDLLLVAGTNRRRSHHSSTSESTSATRVNLPLSINGKHAEKQNHAIFLNPFAVLFLYRVCYSLIHVKRCTKISVVVAYFSHSVVLKSSTSIFWLTAEHSKKVIIRLVWMNTNSAGLITEQPFLFYPILSRGFCNTSQPFQRSKI